MAIRSDREGVRYRQALKAMTDREVLVAFEQAVAITDEDQIVLCRKEMQERGLEYI